MQSHVTISNMPAVEASLVIVVEKVANQSILFTVLKDCHSDHMIKSEKIFLCKDSAFILWSVVRVPPQLNFHFE